MRLAIAISTTIGLFAAFIGAMLHISATQAHACSAPAPDLEREFESVDSVFWGLVESTDSLNIRGNEYEDIVKLKVLEVWKGEPYETIYIKSVWEKRTEDGREYPCPPSSRQYTTGWNYIVFARDGRADLRLSAASKSLYYYSSHPFLRELGRGEKPNLGTVGPIPERTEQPVEKHFSSSELQDERSIGGCNLGFSQEPNGLNLSIIGLAAMLAWFWIRGRFSR